MTTHRYLVKYGDIHGSDKRYCVVDKDDKMKVVFADNSKVDVIAKAQALNGFNPVDGSEATYGKQIAT